MIYTAKQFAMSKHYGQLDDSGQDYFDAHIRKVVEILRVVGASQTVIEAAYLHDTLEDTNTTYEDLVKYFGKEVADLVNEVTHEGDETLGYYFPRLKSKEAVMIKFADRLSNLSRMEPWSDRRRDHYVKRSKFWKSEK